MIDAQRPEPGDEAFAALLCGLHAWACRVQRVAAVPAAGAGPAPDPEVLDALVGLLSWAQAGQRWVEDTARTPRADPAAGEGTPPAGRLLR